MDLINLKSVDLIRVPPKIGDILVCGGCGTFNEVTLQGTKPMTKAEYDALSVEESADLNFAMRALKPQKRNDQ